MNQRTMVKISAEENVITLRTFSREYRSPQGFIILRSELEKLKLNKKVIVSDIRSFAILRLQQTPAGLDVIDFDFSWLSDAGGKRLSGREEYVRLPYDVFWPVLRKVYSLKDSTGRFCLFLKEINLKLNLRAGTI